MKSNGELAPQHQPAQNGAGAANQTKPNQGAPLRQNGRPQPLKGGKSRTGASSGTPPTAGSAIPVHQPAPKLVGQPPTPIQNGPVSADRSADAGEQAGPAGGAGAPTYQRPPGIQTLQVNIINFIIG